MELDFPPSWDESLREAAEALGPLPLGERQWDVLRAKFEAVNVKVSLEVIRNMSIQSIIPLHFRSSSDVDHPPRMYFLSSFPLLDRRWQNRGVRGGKTPGGRRHSAWRCCVSWQPTKRSSTARNGGC
mmetsp:Transcript_21224/g.60902  ORF Transcript_21224/g.60902 Transcript_21224/m.60902 type:complete len:127 (+) Transcript_21224:151-531(+)